MNERLLRRAEVLEKTGLSNSTLWRLEKSGGFPARRHISAGAVAWLETEIKAWMTGCKAVSTDTVKPVAPGAKRGRKPKAQVRKGA